MNPKIYSASGELEVVTFRQFLRKVKRRLEGDTYSSTTHSAVLGAPGNIQAHPNGGFYEGAAAIQGGNIDHNHIGGAGGGGNGFVGAAGNGNIVYTDGTARLNINGIGNVYNHYVVDHTAPTYLGAGGFNGDVTANTVTTRSYLYKSIVDNDIFKDFFSYSEIKFTHRKPLWDFINEMSMMHLDNYGTNGYLVNFGVRSWFIAHPDDFELVLNNNKYILTYQKQPNIWVMEK